MKRPPREFELSGGSGRQFLWTQSDMDRCTLATLSVYRNGTTQNMPGGRSDHVRAKRGQIEGWSASAVRRHKKWLYSIASDELVGHGYAVTLTMRETPVSARELAALRDKFIKRLGRRGLLRDHWVVEWQRRGTPHFHMALYFERELSVRERFELLADWCQLANPYGAQLGAQDLKPIDGATGWLRYLSKHAARGVAHYQRQGKPEGWGSTGRLWGRGGEWPEDEPLRFDVPRAEWFRVRRIVRGWRLADAQKETDPARRRERVMAARRMLRGRDRKVSEVRGISEWLDQDTMCRVLSMLADQGVDVRQID
jgi:hypothetical protein